MLLGRFTQCIMIYREVSATTGITAFLSQTKLNSHKQPFLTITRRFQKGQISELEFMKFKEQEKKEEEKKSHHVRQWQS